MPEKQKDVVFFGKTDFRNEDRIFGIKRIDRRQHTYVIGKTGTGKTTLLRNLVIQDIANGEGVCVVDPHGEFVEDLLKMIPKDRLEDVVYFNPSDPDYHVGFNPLELADKRYKHLIASGLMGIFTKIWAGVWSARMEYILNNAVLALLDTPGSTLLGITKLLVDKEFRQKIVANIEDPTVKAFWVQEYEVWKEQFRNEAISPIQNKVGQFLSTALIRNIVGQQKSTIDILDIMNQGKIFLVNVSKGRIGEDNSALLGAMLITKIQLAAMDRIRIPEDERVDFYLYVDEFQNFATDSFANILSEARKYRLALTLAHQYVGQLVTDVSTKVRDAIFGNVGTMLIFRVGAADADFLAKEVEPEFTPQDMVNLPNRRIYLKLMVDGVTSRPFSANTLPPIKTQFEAADPDEVIKNSRKRYARPRYIIEEEISAWLSVVQSGQSLGKPQPEYLKPSGAPREADRGREDSRPGSRTFDGVSREMSSRPPFRPPEIRRSAEPAVKETPPTPVAHRPAEPSVIKETPPPEIHQPAKTEVNETSVHGARQFFPEIKKPTISLSSLMTHEPHRKKEESADAKADIDLARKIISEALSQRYEEPDGSADSTRSTGSPRQDSGPAGQGKTE
ncbi:MAG: type IV secretion system DNA-binding domain-containing protein [Candidatus Liptonbacteria bacterium]|nr:type IV secretion system DNA-binding domain-containing protein [Candidatus Liptonbacteria bacterium]